MPGAAACVASAVSTKPTSRTITAANEEIDVY
jgi:hypothetical protein